MGVGGGGNLPSDHFRIIKKALVLPISSRMSRFCSFYDETFYKNLICPKGINYDPCPEGYWGKRCYPQISRPFNYFEQHEYIQMLSGNVWGNDWRGGADSPSDHFRPLKKTIGLSISKKIALIKVFTTTLSIKPFMPPGHNLQS